MPADHLRDLLRGLVARPSPAGSEAGIAGWLTEWAATRWPGIDWRLDAFDGSRANVVGHSVLGRAPSLLFYGHLDTSLSGDSRWDRFVVGAPSPPARARFAAGLVSGPGVAV
ncbi:MAG: hypothetical protein J2P57_25825, partial [Acidimicrobiaceae bacterium]|nr:hypothetical protein [Acidimicrobiaceae bacterium]